MIRSFTKMVLFMLLLLTLTTPAKAEMLAHEALEEKATNYLKLLDQGLYEKAWFDMSEIFHGLNIPQLWEKRQATIRTAYGAMYSRRLHHISYRQTYNLSPDGQYVIVQFKSSFQNKLDIIETIVLDCRVDSECSVREYIIR